MSDKNLTLSLTDRKIAALDVARCYSEVSNSSTTSSTAVRNRQDSLYGMSRSLIACLFISVVATFRSKEDLEAVDAMTRLVLTDLKRAKLFKQAEVECHIDAILGEIPLPVFHSTRKSAMTDLNVSFHRDESQFSFELN